MTTLHEDLFHHSRFFTRAVCFHLLQRFTLQKMSDSIKWLPIGCTRWSVSFSDPMKSSSHVGSQPNT